MITVKDRSTGHLFDMWDHIGPKRRKLLDSSWAGVFRKFLLEKLPVSRIVRYFTEGTGRPSKELYTMIGALILQQLHDLSDPDVTRAVAFNIDWHYALDINTDRVMPRGFTARQSPAGYAYVSPLVICKGVAHFSAKPSY